MVTLNMYYVAAAVLFSQTTAVPLVIDQAAAVLSSMISSYAPVVAICPSTPLFRAADSISSNETLYRTQRKTIADAALKT